MSASSQPHSNLRSIYQDSSINMKALLTVLGIATVIVGIYLTNHYFEIKYPEGLSAGSLCDINSYFNCDGATHSRASNIFGVPISVFGLVLGVLVLAGFLFKSPKYESSLHIILYANAFGCLVLLIYSLAALGSLCPFCTIYYLLSFGLLALFYKLSDHKKPDVLFLALFALVFAIAGAISLFNISRKEKNQAALAVSLISQFDSYEKLSAPAILSPHHIAKSTDTFSDAPIQLIIFSDFQCPACKMLSNMMAPIAKRYAGKINILYYFFPLDNACNPDMKVPVHPLACSLAYLANCSGEKFHQVHDEIFDIQDDLTNEWIKNYAAKQGVEACMDDPANKNKVVELLSQGKNISVRSTPTLWLNGVKIEGALPLNQFYILMDELVKRHGKNP